MDFDRILPDIGPDIKAEHLSLLASQAFERISFTFTREHLDQLASIVNSPGSSDNDRMVASLLLQNAIIAARGEFPLCQDTGIAQVFGWKDSSVRTDGSDYEALTAGIEQTYRQRNLRFSTTVPSSLFDETDPQNNLPAQIHLSATPAGSAGRGAYRFLFCAKGGGSSNKTSFFQMTKAMLNEKAFTAFLEKNIAALGTTACPPNTIAIIVGGLSPEQNLLALKLATTGYLDHDLAGWDYRIMGSTVLRDRNWEKRVLDIASSTGLGAQFGGQALATQARVFRLSRHGASCPVSIGVSCSAHRNLHAYIDESGIYLERTVADPSSIPGLAAAAAYADTPRSRPLAIDLNAGMEAVRSRLSGIPTGTALSLSGKILVARDAAHARWRSALEAGQSLPDYVRQYPIIYAGPAQTPTGRVTGSFGPTTAGRMDDYAEDLMSRGAALVTMAKGNRSEGWRQACRTYGATYLGIIGGAAALIAASYIESSEVLDFPDLGMEAVRLVTVRDLPAFVLINDSGEDFYALSAGRTT